jgi:hypothetical protein
MGKTWHFITSYSKKTKQKLSCNIKSAKIKSKRKITVLPPTKRFFIAILLGFSYLFSRGNDVV